MTKRIKAFFRKKGADKPIFFAVFVLICLGIVMIGSASIGAVSSKGTAFAIKNKNPVVWNQKEPVEVLAVNNALSMDIIYNRMRTLAFMANLDCHEFSRSYALKSSTGKTYVRQRRQSVRENTRAAEYIAKVFSENSGNIYFAPNGLGLFAALVGEFYIGNESLSKILVQKGYCSYVE